MSIRLTSQESRVALYDSVTGYAFGPTFADEDEASSFLDWLERYHADPRALRISELENAYARWYALRAAARG